MKFIAYADIHFYHGWSEFNDLQPSSLAKRFEIQLDVWDQIDALAKKHNAIKLCAGDVFNKRSFLHNTVVNEVIRRYKGKCAPEYLISGNHDRFDQNYSAVQILEGLGDAEILTDKASSLSQVLSKVQQSFDLYGATPGGPIPVPTDPSATNILVAHGQLQGATTPSGFEFQNGYTLKDLAAFDLVVLGDIHKHQQIGNVLIPGSPLQLNWGDAGQERGCWLIDVLGKGQITRTFIPLKSPKFIIVTAENLEEVLQTPADDYNYYDFRITQRLEKAEYKELKERFPNSYIVLQAEKRSSVAGSSTIDAKLTPQELLEKYFDLRLSGNKEQFVKTALAYLTKASPAALGSHKQVKFLNIKAQNFLAFKQIELDLESLKPELYLITGTSDEETSSTNGIGKSALAVELITYALFNMLARSAVKDKNKLIHDPEHTGKAKELLVEVKMSIGGTTYLVQRYRKHSELGTGSRIFVKE